MHYQHWMGIIGLAVVLAIATGSGIAAASPSVDVGNGTIDDIGSTTTVNLTLDSVPDGLSGYNLTVSLSGQSIAEILSVSFPAWATLHDNSTLPADSVWLKAADLMGSVGSGDTNIPLGTLTIRGDAAGVCDIVVTVTKMDDDDGNPINPAADAGHLKVGEIPPTITSWSNNRTNDGALHITLNESESVRFNATADQTITTWNWFRDGIHQSDNNDSYTTSWGVNGTHNVSVNAANANGTSDTKTWTVAVSSHDRDYPDISWNMAITATNQSEPVVVGMHPNATDGYDGGFDAYTETPVQGKVIQILDAIYSTSIKKTRCYNESVTWNLAVGVPTGQTTTLSWTVPSNVNLTITKGNITLHSGVELTEGSNELLVTAKIPEYVAFSLDLDAGWNMVSLPVTPDNCSVHAVFGSIPTLETKPVVTWKSPSFVEVENVEPKRGYLVFTPTNTTINIIGKPVTNTTLILEAGWNMIGTVGLDNLAISDIPNQVPQRPAVTIPSSVETDLIEPGTSAWVFVTVDAIVNIAPGKAVSTQGSGM